MSWTRLLLVVPFLLLAVVGALALSSGSDSTSDRSAAPIAEPPGRLFVVIVDSLRTQNLDHPDEMPKLRALSEQPHARRFDLRTCSANFSMQCLQTLLEGQESPFGADLTRITGTTASPTSLPALAQGAGLRVVLLSYDELVKVYEQLTTRAVNSSSWDPDTLKRDLRIIDEAIGLLDEIDPHVLILHVDGTDKAAHYKKPGTELYREHFRIVDAKLTELWKKVDFEHDAVVILGDHGHDEDGHHVRHSQLILAGSPLVSFIDAVALPEEGLASRDLLFLYAYYLGLDVPEGYEGQYLDAAEGTDPPPQVEAFLNSQARALAERGYQGERLMDRVAQRQSHLDQRHVRSLYANLPLLLCYFGMLLWWHGRRRLRWRLGAIAGFGALAAVFTQLDLENAGLWVAVPVTLAAMAPLLWPNARRRTAFLLAIVVVGAALSYIARDWALYFHTTGGARGAMLVFFGVMLAAGLALAWVRDRAPAHMPWTTAGFCVFCLPSGVYYYQAGQNMMHGFALGLGALLLFTLATRPRQLWSLAQKHWRKSLVVPVALFALCTPLLFLQEAGAWKWNHLTRPLLDRLGNGPMLLIYYAVGAILLWRLRCSWRGKLGFAAAWLLSHGYAVGIGQLPMAAFLIAQVPLVLFFAWDELQQAGGVQLNAGDEPADLNALLWFGAMMTSVWFVFGGFEINNIDYTFVNDYLGWVHQQKNRFLLSYVASVVKYGCPAIAALVYLYVKVGPSRTAALLEGILFFANFKLAMLLQQVLVSALGTKEKIFQLPMTDGVFVVAAFATTALSLLVFTVIEKIKARRTPAPPLAPA